MGNDGKGPHTLGKHQNNCRGGGRNKGQVIGNKAKGTTTGVGGEVAEEAVYLKGRKD